jgi:hypothetical protein
METQRRRNALRVSKKTADGARALCRNAINDVSVTALVAELRRARSGNASEKRYNAFELPF